MPTPLQVGVIGFGKMGLLHASVANGLEIFELTAAADPTAGLLESLKRLKPGLAIYEDYETHAGRAAARRGLHHQSDALASADGPGVRRSREFRSSSRSRCRRGPPTAATCWPRCSEKPVTNAVGYMARHIDTFRKARAVVASGAMGRCSTCSPRCMSRSCFAPAKAGVTTRSIPAAAS